jgi:hypothetical protein
MLAKDADAVLGENGITAKSSINRAKKKLGIRSAKAQVGAPWWWLLHGQDIPASPTTLGFFSAGLPRLGLSAAAAPFFSMCSFRNFLTLPPSSTSISVRSIVMVALLRLRLS